MIKWYKWSLKVESYVNFQYFKKYKAEHIKIFIINVTY